MPVLRLYFWNSYTIFVRYYLRRSYLIYRFYLLFFLAYLFINEYSDYYHSHSTACESYLRIRNTALRHSSYFGDGMKES